MTLAHSESLVPQSSLDKKKEKKKKNSDSFQQDITTDFFKRFYAQTIMKYSSVACHCLQIVFAFSQHSKWFTYDGKAMLSYPGVTHARFALVIVAG